MASQISINTEAARSIYEKSKSLIQEIRDQLSQLNSEITDLPDRGEWKGDAADKFMGIYGDMQNEITNEFPQLLDELADNLDKNLQNLIEADSAGA